MESVSELVHQLDMGPQYTSGNFEDTFSLYHNSTCAIKVPCR